MNSWGVVSAEPVPPGNIAIGLRQRSATSADGVVEEWLREHLNLVAIAVVAAAFVTRVFAASSSYMNPDEALDYVLLNQTSIFRAYQASLTNIHPPLLYLLLYVWHFLGRSELMLRLPSVLAGSAFCWVSYKWIGIAFGRAASLFGLILMAFSPAMIALSAEARHYALLLFFEAGALYLMELALQENSVRKMCYFSIALYLAILCHYSAVFFALAVGVYALARIFDSLPPRRVVAAWVGGQAGALTVCGFLYLTQLSKLKDNFSNWSSFYENGYFHVGRESLFAFTRRGTAAVFSFMFENPYTATALLLLWALTVSFLLVRDLTTRGDRHRARYSGILLTLPFVAVWCAALGGFYPYIGSRHTAFLFPFVVAGLGVPIGAVYVHRLWAIILIAVLLVVASNTSGQTFEPYITRENQNRALMAGAVQYIQQSVPASEVILTDFQSGVMAMYYLCGPRQIVPIETLGGSKLVPFDQLAGMYYKVECNGHLIISSRTLWVLPEVFPAQFEQLASAAGLKSGDKVWVFQAGWGVELVRRLPWISPRFRCLAPKKFGKNIAVIPFVVGPDLYPAATVTSCPPPAFNSFIE
jgi:4-amino-4-deoxy-L-arabinose transferase-like glycosyltransferase